MTQTITPYIAVADARAAIQWYARALGATTTHPPVVMSDGRVGHAEVEIGGARVMLSDAHPELGVVAPSDGAAAVTLHLSVDDCDATVDRARSAGGRVDREPGDGPPGRIATFWDPFGHRWMVNGPVRAG